MDPRMRFAPALLVGIMLVAKSAFPGFLRIPLVEGAPFTWYQASLALLVPLSVYMVAPGLARLLAALPRRKVLYPLVVVIALFGALALVEGAYNHFNDACGVCPETHFLNSLTSAFFGA